MGRLPVRSKLAGDRYVVPMQRQQRAAYSPGIVSIVPGVSRKRKTGVQ